MTAPLELSHDVLAEAVYRAPSGDRDERHVARLPGLEAHRRASGDVEPHAAGLFAVEFKRGVGFEEMVVRADLDRPVAAIRDRERDALTPFIDLDFAGLDEIFAGDHVDLIVSARAR